jgi:DNA-binding IclR family transcriptional regulator
MTAMVQSVERALALLELLAAAEPGGLALGELAGRAGLKGPTAHHLLATLAALGYARQVAETRRYGLGPRALALGRRRDLAETLTDAAEPAVAALRAAVNETVVLALWDAGRRHTLLTAESEQPLRVAADTGFDDRFLTTATGRVLLAQLDPERLAGWPEALAVAADLSRIATAGAARHVDPAMEVVALAVPVPAAEVNASLGLYLPLSRSSAAREAELLAALEAAAAAIGAEFNRRMP